jgi:hypothetical protein
VEDPSLPMAPKSAYLDGRETSFSVPTSKDHNSTAFKRGQGAELYALKK